MAPRRKLVLFAMAAAFVMAHTPAWSAPILSVSVASPVAVGTAVDATVTITGVTDLYAFQFDLRFDPSVVNAVDVVEGPFLSGAGGTVFLPGMMDNLAGVVSFTADTLIAAVPGASGSGTLAMFRLSAVGAGTSPLTLSNVILLDSALGDLEATTTDGSVEVTGGTVVPEPASLLLLGTGLIGAVRAARRRRG